VSTESEAAPIDGQEQESAPVVEDHGQEQAGADHEATDPAPSGDDPEKKTPKGVQKRLDEMRRQIGDQQRLNERLIGLLEKGGMPTRQAEQQVAAKAEPVRGNYASHEEYLEARADYRAAQTVETILAKREATERASKAQREADQQQSTWKESVDKAKAKYDDFDEVALADPKDGGPAITEQMADAIRTSDIGPDIAYYLGKNRAESLRIAALSPAAQAREIGRIEVKVAGPAGKTRAVSRAAPGPSCATTCRWTNTCDVATSR
jgi:hypothetical protein